MTGLMVMACGDAIDAKALWQELGVKSCDNKNNVECLGLLISYLCCGPMFMALITDDAGNILVKQQNFPATTQQIASIEARVKELEQLGFPNVNGGGNGNGDGIPVGGSSNNVSSTTGPVVDETFLEELRFWRVVDETSSTNRTHGERLLRRSGRGGRGK